MHDTQTIQTAFIVVAAAALALQTIFMIVLAVMAGKAIRKVKEELEEYRAVVIPIFTQLKPMLEKTRELVDKLAPRVDEISEQLTVVTKAVRDQTADVQAAASDIIDRTRRQANRVDNIVTSVLNKMEHAGEVVADVMARPMRQVSGLIASIKAAVDVLREQPAPPPPAPRVVTTRYADGETASTVRPISTTTPFHP